MPHLIAPSLLSADFSQLKKDIEMVNASQADWFHIDVMDGVFVPNISFGFPVIRHIKKYAKKPLDVHLMIIKPDRYLENCKDEGADIISVHYEACKHLHRTVNAIKSLGLKAGVALNPHTSVQLFEDVIRDIDMVLLMSVNPGFGGQTFIEQIYNKTRKLKEMILDNQTSTLIEIDGGITLENAPKLIDCGADVLVVGNTVFSSENPAETIKRLKNI